MVSVLAFEKVRRNIFTANAVPCCVAEFRPVLESINLVGPQLCQISPGEGASTIEGLVTRDNRRFDAIAEQIQRKGERIQLSKKVDETCGKRWIILGLSFVKRLMYEIIRTNSRIVWLIHA